RECGGRPLQGAAGIARGVPRRRGPRAHVAERAVFVALVLARRPDRAQRRRRHSRRRRRRLHAERPLSRRSGAADRQPYDDRPREAALRQPRDLQGDPRRHLARGVQRQDHRPAGRAEDRREADQPRAAADRRRHDQHEAAARDLRRRRQVHARRGDRPARRRGDLLPARAGHDVRRGARHADPRLRRPGARGRGGRAAPRRARGGAVRAAREGSGRGGREGMTPQLRAGLRVAAARADFPILARQVHGKSLVYLDNAATTQKPQAVLDAVARYFRETNANVHRGVHELSARATDQYEAARERVRRYFNAASVREIVFTRNATEGINLVAYSFVKPKLREGDEVLISTMEHHSNIVPWQLVCDAAGARLRVAPIDDAGTLRLDEFDRLLGPRTRIAAITHMSNALGTITPAREIAKMARQKNVPVLIDASQAAYHMRVDVQALDCDFLVATGHKMYGPTGIG